VSHYEVNTAVNYIVAAPPCGGYSTGCSMVFKDTTPVAIHLRVTARRQASQTGTDDDYRISHDTVSKESTTNQSPSRFVVVYDGLGNLG